MASHVAFMAPCQCVFRTAVAVRSLLVSRTEAQSSMLHGARLLLNLPVSQPIRSMQGLDSHDDFRVSGKKARKCVGHGKVSAVKGVDILSTESGFSSLASFDGEKTSLSGFLARVTDCNTGLERRNEFWPFLISGIPVGFVHESFMFELAKYEDVFVLSPSPKTLFSKLEAQTEVSLTAKDNKKNEKKMEKKGKFQVELHPNLVTLQERTKAVGGVLKKMRKKGLITGWRDELYPVSSAFHAPPLLLVERAAAAMFGVKVYGVHMNGFVRTENGELNLWVARRSLSKPTFPGKLDHLVAGGQPHGLSCEENVVKECDEEAGIPNNLAKRAVPVGAVSYESVVGSTLKRDVLFCYDLELPRDFVPYNKVTLVVLPNDKYEDILDSIYSTLLLDGEVDSFVLLPLDKVVDIINKTTDYKPNCALVVIDFLVRHGLVTPEQRGYLELIRSLRLGDCS